MGIQGEEGRHTCGRLICFCGGWAHNWSQGSTLMGGFQKVGFDILVDGYTGLIEKISTPLSLSKTMYGYSNEHSGKGI